MTGTASSQAECEIAKYTDLYPAGDAPRLGAFSWQEWLANDEAQTSVVALNMALEERFGDLTRQDGSDPLSKGLIGSVADDLNEQIVVVVDETVVDTVALQDTLENAVAESDGGKTQLGVRVSPSCHSSKNLLSVRDYLEGKFFDESTASYAISLSGYDSAFHVTVDPAEEKEAQELLGRFGSSVQIEAGDVALTSRQVDGDPHYGAAGIRPKPKEDNQCTSLATVHLPGGGLGSVSVGHCLNNGHQVMSGPEYPETGTKDYGTAHGKSDYPNYDMIRIAPVDGESFTNIIHVDPCCPALREVTGAGDPGMNQFVCASGKTTLAVCGLKVSDVDLQFCLEDQPNPVDNGCRHHTFRVEKPGEAIVDLGDSGGPIYAKPNSTDARIRGMIIGAIRHQGVYDTIAAHNWSAIRDHLDVTIAT